MYLLSLLNISTEKSREIMEKLKNVPCPPGVKIHGTYGVFGKYDCCLWFEAPNEKVALDFVAEKIRPLPGVISTETYITREI